HDGTKLALRKLDADYDPHDRLGAQNFLQKHAAKGQIVTGLLYVDPESEDLHAHLNTPTLRSGRRRSQQSLPLAVEPRERVGRRRRHEAAARLDDEIILAQPRQGVIDVEICGDADRAKQELLDTRIEALARHGRGF
ncbi:hypothetical protein KXW38_002086, partial [Aspergillus fumigatus]